MKKHKSLFKTFALMLFIAFNFSSKGQVSINNTGNEPNASAMLDISSTNKGLLIPRMTRQQRQSISNPANGLLVFETDNSTMGFYYFNGNVWQKLEIAGSDWGLQGNSGTNSGNFIGTTDAVDLNFKVNNKTVLSLTQKGQLETGGTGFSVFLGKYAGEHDDLSDNYNVFVGESAGYSNTTGYNNVASGYKALYSNTTSHSNCAVGYKALYSTRLNGKNTAVGCESLFFNTAQSNTATGFASLYSNTTGNSNSAFGSEALTDNTTGSSNTACGNKALTSNTTGFANSSLGDHALYNNKTGVNNTAIGANALYINNGNWNTAIGEASAFYNYTGSRNTSVGNYSLYKNYSGKYNTAIGNCSLLRNQYGSSLVAVGDSALLNNGDGGDSTLGLYNTAVGAQSFTSNTTGNYNTALGYKTDVLSSGLNYATALGSKAHVAVSNALVLGGTGDAYVKVGIGTAAPENLLDIVSPASSDADVRVLSPDAHKSSLKLFESGNYGYEFQYNGNNDKLNLWSRTFAGNEGIRMTWLKNGNVGIGTQTPSYKLQIGIAGDGSQARANAWNTFSDKRWKTNIVLIDNPLKKLQSINGYYYNWKNGTDKSTQVGVIAQEVEKVLPEIVSTDDEGYKSLDYSKLAPLLIEAVKQQQQIISKQNEQILQLQKKIAEIDALKHDLEALKKRQTDR